MMILGRPAGNCHRNTQFCPCILHNIYFVHYDLGVKKQQYNLLGRFRERRVYLQGRFFQFLTDFS
jgi:hypothetical protein